MGRFRVVQEMKDGRPRYYVQEETKFLLWSYWETYSFGMNIANGFFPVEYFWEMTDAQMYIQSIKDKRADIERRRRSEDVASKSAKVVFEEE